ncbi:hypothetical protein CHCC20335_3369 [Bacillus paralicheniformis]|nr:hypothetical protein CHCC20335_3369 [Bacillus paralicheniformis]
MPFRQLHFLSFSNHFYKRHLFLFSTCFEKIILVVTLNMWSKKLYIANMVDTIQGVQTTFRKFGR